jgi:hypothetical protein
VEAFRDGRWVLHLVLDTDATWSFGYAEPPQAGYLNRDGSGSGMIVDMLRYPAVTLFILALAKVDPSFVVANETGEVVTAPPETLAVDRDVLIALGLIPRSLRALLAVETSPSGDWFFSRVLFFTPVGRTVSVLPQGGSVRPPRHVEEKRHDDKYR